MFCSSFVPSKQLRYLQSSCVFIEKLDTEILGENEIKEKRFNFFFIHWNRIGQILLTMQNHCNSLLTDERANAIIINSYL